MLQFIERNSDHSVSERMLLIIWFIAFLVKKLQELALKTFATYWKTQKNQSVQPNILQMNNATQDKIPNACRYTGSVIIKTSCMYEIKQV